MSEAQRRSGQQLFQEARNMHIENRTESAVLENRINFMQKKIQEHSKLLSCSLCNSGKVKAEPGFKRAFKTLSFNQKIRLYWRCCKVIKEIKSKSKDNPEMEPPSPSTLQKDLIDTTIYIKDKNEHKNWSVTRVISSCSTRKITIPDSSTVLDMHDFIIRSAKDKQRNCFALESTQDKEPEPTILVSNQGLSFEQTLGFFKKVFRLALKDEISEVLNPNANETVQEMKMPKKVNTLKVNSKQSISDKTSPLLQKFITMRLASAQYALQPLDSISRQMRQKERFSKIRDESFNDINKRLVPPKLMERVDDIKGYEKVKESDSCTTYYMKSQNKVKKKYSLNSKDIIILDWLVDQINNYPKYREWKRGLKQVSCVKVFPAERTKLIHEMHVNNGKTCNYFYLRHHFTTDNPESTSSQSKRIYYFFDQSINEKLSSSLFKIPQPMIEIEYVLWKFYETGGMFYLTVEAKCDHKDENKEQNLKMLEDYLGTINVICSQGHQKTLDDNFLLNTVLFEDQYLEQISEIESSGSRTEYFTVTDSYADEKPSLPNKENSIMQNISRLLPSMKRKSVSFDSTQLQNVDSLLKFKHPVIPYKKGVPKIKKPIYGSHPQWEKEWQINAKGELINCNKEKIEAQNSVLKGVFKIIGRNLATGKSILNVSIPVQVFGDDSNLSRLCHSYGYAPLFLEQASKAQDPIERFKQVVAFSMTSTVLYLRMDKPFNPILGETYQNLVDGCPIYGQQISHHPPISAVFLKGRGYTLFGSLEAKVQLSLNSASGSNQGEISISFDQNDLSKEIVKYTTPAGQLSGVIYGDRKMAMIKKSYFYDQTNQLFCEFTWGKHKGKSETSNKLADTVEGQLVKLKPRPNAKDWKTIKKEDIDSTLGLFSGRWTGAVYYDGELLFDTYQSYPHQIEDFKALLESDTSKRKDLILRRDAVNIDQAQLAKEQLEELQRRDRKLRGEHAPKK